MQGWLLLGQMSSYLLAFPFGALDGILRCDDYGVMGSFGLGRLSLSLIPPLNVLDTPPSI